MATTRRSQLYINPPFQRPIVRRVCIYWFICLLFITLPLVIAETMADPSKLFVHHLGQLLYRFWPAYVSMLCLLPFLLLDCLRVTHRVAGPIVRVRQQISKVLKGESVTPINFRSDDPWREFADEVNQLVAAGQSKPT